MRVGGASISFARLMCCVPGTLARSPLGRSRRCLVPSRFLERRESRDREDRVPCLCSIPGRHKPSCATSCHLLWLPAMSLLTSLRCMQRRERGQQRWRTRRRRKSRWARGIAAAAHVAALIHGPIAFDEREGTRGHTTVFGPAEAVENCPDSRPGEGHIHAAPAELGVRGFALRSVGGTV